MSDKFGHPYLAIRRPNRLLRISLCCKQHCQNCVSGWLIGSTPTRLTIDVMVPSASASTQAARCSNPRYGNPGSSTHPDAAPVHSGSDGVVSEGDAASAMQGVDDQRNILAELLIHRRRCPRPAPDRRSPARVRRATLRGHQTPLWWRASRATTRPELRPSAAGPTLWSNQANVQRSRTLSGHHANGREKPQ